MILTVKRNHFGPDATVGELYIDGERFCYTLEDTVREIAGAPVEAWKVPKRTAIPFGTYAVEMTYSNRFGKVMPQIMNVPGFSGVRIHSGNTAADTEGCLLVGNTCGEDFIGRSREAFDRLLAHIELALGRGETVTIEYTGRNS